ncbi:hypothetical protein GCM10023149_13730 [Mucilaginibacter gynuensis]|uniref:Response regulatory domain-containing protein n=2 Tax=Mucilaginibacter gynuensis TaxID=1302236 RepID=A0ABP8G3F2_9SPHI
MRKMIDVYVPSAPTVQYLQEGGKALQFLAENKNNAEELPDIILLDIHMPLMSGWQFLEIFKNIRGTLSKPVWVYVVSSSIDPVDIHRSKEYNFVHDYIIKPITKNKLQDILK